MSKWSNYSSVPNAHLSLMVGFQCLDCRTCPDPLVSWVPFMINLTYTIKQRSTTHRLMDSKWITSKDTPLLYIVLSILCNTLYTNEDDSKILRTLHSVKYWSITGVSLTPFNSSNYLTPIESQKEQTTTEFIRGKHSEKVTQSIVLFYLWPERLPLVY